MQGWEKREGERDIRDRKSKARANMEAVRAHEKKKKQFYRLEQEKEENETQPYPVPLADFATCPAGGSGAPYLPIGKSRFGPMATAYRSNNGIVPLEYGPCSRVIGEVQGRWGPQCIGAFPSEYVGESDVSLGCALSSSSAFPRLHPLASSSSSSPYYAATYGFYKGGPGGNEPVVITTQDAGHGRTRSVFSAPTSGNGWFSP